MLIFCGSRRKVRMRVFISCIAHATFCWLFILGGHCLGAEKRANGKVKVFVLSGQSNMVGFGQVTNPKNQRGTMEFYTKEFPDKYGHLMGRRGKPEERKDVWVVSLGQVEKSGWLTTGFGKSDNQIGPEYAFGQVIGDYFEDPVVLIKVAWGGRSLFHNFLPPSAEDYPEPEKDGDKGFEYHELVRQVKLVTSDLKEYFPKYRGGGYELLGLGWHQGWNDRVSKKGVEIYEGNLVHLVEDLRKDLEAEDLPFVVANTGMQSKQNYAGRVKKKAEEFMDSQLAITKKRKYQNIGGVDTREFWRPVEESPSGQNYHWNQNWESYFLIGEAMGNEMLKFLE